jgi:hypothetical protein
VLLPGGSLICVVDPSPQLLAAGAALDHTLRYWWTLRLLRDEPEVWDDLGIRTRQHAGLWYVKGRNRRGPRTILPDVLRSGDAVAVDRGWCIIWPLIEHLTNPGETVIDPFGNLRWRGVVTEDWLRVSGAAGWRARTIKRRPGSAALDAMILKYCGSGVGIFIIRSRAVTSAPSQCGNARTGASIGGVG